MHNLVLLLAPAATEAVPLKAAAEPSLLGLTHTETIVLILVIFSVVLLAAAIVLARAFEALAREQVSPRPYTAFDKEAALPYLDWKKQRRQKRGWLEKILELKPVSGEKDYMLEHAYDEIYELDNPVPKWFNVLFYGTIVIGVIYMFYNHLGPGLRQDDEYRVEMAEAAKAKELYLATAANAIDENSVKQDPNPTTITSGRNIFAENCAVCHGDKGQGLIGPNLTDEYWLHGGDINHVFKTIKYGVPEKGMVSWEKTLSPKQIAEVSNYILSLSGTNPPGAKEPQGEKFAAIPAAPAP